MTLWGFGGWLGCASAGADSRELSKQDTTVVLVPHEGTYVQMKPWQLWFGIQRVYRKWLHMIYKPSINGGCKFHMRNPACCPGVPDRGRAA